METREMSPCNRLDLESLGYQPNMPQNLPGHCSAANTNKLNLMGCLTFCTSKLNIYRFHDWTAIYVPCVGKLVVSIKVISIYSFKSLSMGFPSLFLN